MRQYIILNACAQDEELFYYPFAELNYGGQVFNHNECEECAQYIDEGDWKSKISAEQIACELVELIGRGLLDCWRLDDSTKERTILVKPSLGEFAVYKDYSCLTWQDHIDKFG